MLDSENLKLKALLGLFLGAIIGLIQYDTGDDYLITEKSVALSANRIKVFQYLTDAANYERVSASIDKSKEFPLHSISISIYIKPY